MNLRELINKVVFRNSKYEIIKNNLISQHFSKNELKIEFEHIMAHRLMNTKDFFFIQVGANVGISTMDPIYKSITNKTINGLCLEPIPFYFNKLVENYKGLENVSLINAALHPSDDELAMYKIDENAIGKNGVPTWTSGIATFDKRVMEKHGRDIPDYEKHLVTEKVKCISFENLLTDYNVTKIDLLLIDTEGFDYEVIKMVDFNKIKPAIIMFEHKHLLKNDLFDCVDMLTSIGYKLFCKEPDITAYLY